MKPWLWLPPEWSHALAPRVLPLLALCASKGSSRWKPLTWKGLNFENPLGIAGGVDKEGTQLLAWQNLGAGFLEVGTVTPRPQGPNPGLIMDRDLNTLSVWNKMGFPNPGAESVKKQLLKIESKIKVPLFINLGKNRDTENQEALKDYSLAFQILKDCADTFVVNISSPNTKGLRDLQGREHLRNLLAGLRQIASDKKLLLKLSPDLTSDSLKEALDLGVQEQMDGFILTNTTLQRNLGSPYPIEGGVSGAPLKNLSRFALEQTVKHLGNIKKDYLLVSVGGILDFEEVQWRLQNGADLTQVYAALVYSGPLFFQKAANYPWH